MAESDMRSRVVRALSPVGGIAVENPVLPGTPDVNYTTGWIELKWLRSWPAQEKTPVVFDHFTAQQRIWHIKRRLVGGRSWLLIQCKREWLLLDGADAALHVNFTNRDELGDMAVKHWRNGLMQKELLECISAEPRNFTLTGADGARLKQMLQAGTGSRCTDTLLGSAD